MALFLFIYIVTYKKIKGKELTKSLSHSEPLRILTDDFFYRKKKGADKEVFNGARQMPLILHLSEFDVVTKSVF